MVELLIIFTGQMNPVVRVKDERLDIVKDALALFKCRKPNKKWVVNRKSNNYTKIKAWDEDNFEMSNSEIEVRFIRFIEEAYKLKTECI